MTLQISVGGGITKKKIVQGQLATLYAKRKKMEAGSPPHSSHQNTSPWIYFYNLGVREGHSKLKSKPKSLKKKICMTK